MNITISIAKWQAAFLLVENSNEPFQQKQHKIWTVVREVTDSYEDIIHSPNVDHANVVLLFANVSMYAEMYNIDTSELRLKTIVAGFKELF